MMDEGASYSKGGALQDGEPGGYGEEKEESAVEHDLGLSHLVEMEIRLNKGANVYYRSYRVSHAERQKVREKVQGLVDSDVQESNSDFASPGVKL
ncbi:hypothetical protein NQ314_015109 [Rhamnusium bicolor]|uniref:Uncharacterized protein n=1 Tax=Rhamnusium bicolor TaxID=1586634 RepID=A0AAV8WZL2_9CUCU|nr:hypothetical protein NQ314_015109 [Rhamnusium bicolor]